MDLNRLRRKHNRCPYCDIGCQDSEMPCTCGADAHNLLVDQAIAEQRKLVEAAQSAWQCHNIAEIRMNLRAVLAPFETGVDHETAQVR